MPKKHKSGRTSGGRRVVAIVPCYNEQGRAGKVVSALLKRVDFVIAVDDGSKDGTVRELLGIRNPRLAILPLPTNLGKGAALLAGFGLARRLGAEVVLTIDSDGQHSLSEIPSFLEAIGKPGVDVVVGCRDFGQGMPLVKKLGNLALRAISRGLFGIMISDSQSGYRCYGPRFLRKVRKWSSPGYSADTEILARAACLKLGIAEVPIRTIYLDKYKGTDIFTGASIMVDIVKWRLLGW